MTFQALPPPPPLSADTSALFLDLDGTIAEIASNPSAVEPISRRSGLLRRLADRLHGRLAVLTGRSLEDADRILEGSVTCIAAVHGLVRRGADGAVTRFQAAAELDRARRTLETMVSSRPGLLLEDKGASLALHYRQAPSAEAAVREVVERIAHSNGLRVQLGHMVAEVRTPGPHKGDCLRAFLHEGRFVGATPIAVGDDLTDEDAFQAAAELGGYGVLVGPPRPSHARFGLSDVEAVLNWLEA